MDEIQTRAFMKKFSLLSDVNMCIGGNKIFEIIVNNFKIMINLAQFKDPDKEVPLKDYPIKTTKDLKMN